MRTVTESYNIYSFSELSLEAKEKVREWYLKGQEPFVFTSMCLERLSELFPKSDLKVQYSLSYCQGDGFNIYGTIHLDELFEKIQDHFSEKEIRFFKWSLSEFYDSCKMQVNNHYCYCICNRNDFIEDLVYDMECNNIRNIPEKTLEKFNEAAGEYLINLCNYFEEQGYDYFYEVSEEILEEYCESNEYEFLENGELFVP